LVRKQKKGFALNMRRKLLSLRELESMKGGRGWDATDLSFSLEENLIF